jgi:hypothetical protein
MNEAQRLIKSLIDSFEVSELNIRVLLIVAISRNQELSILKTILFITRST